MKNATKNYFLSYLLIVLIYLPSLAQEQANLKHTLAAKQLDNYEKLKKLGYNEKEICQDLGNANFLLEKYDRAVFWYQRLKNLNKENELNEHYEKRLQFALQKTKNDDSLIESNNDWLSQIKKDYQLTREFETRRPQLTSNEVFKELDYRPNLRSLSLEYLVEYERKKAFQSDLSKKPNKNLERPKYEEPIAITADRNTAYFSKAVYVKPATGIFSKKELVYKIYRTDKIDGQWVNVREVPLTPKYASAKHPAISKNGTRLFFASNMPGSFGNYDIYATDINRNGITGQVKNLGKKVNTKKNDLYPSLLEDNTLVFASEGREGYGGLDLYMTQIGQKKVGLATNLGSPINSSKDDFSMYLMAERGIGYVLSNRGKNKNVLQQVAFSYSAKDSKPYEKKDKETLLNDLNNKLKIDYTTTVFEDH